MRRVLVIGSGGSGKTTLARRLADRTGIPVIHLDSYFWRPGWEATPPDQWKATVQDLLARDAWIMDGNYGGTLESRLLACDTVVFLDLPRLVCLRRVLIRRLGSLRRDRPELPAGCPERLSWEFLVWIWTYPVRRRGAILRRLAELGKEKRVIILRSPAEVEAFLAGKTPDAA